MVESAGDINRITGPELQAVVSENGGTLESFHALEFIPNVNYRNTPKGFLPLLGSSMLISESQCNRHMGTSLEVAPNELVLVVNRKEMAEEKIDYDTAIMTEPWREGVNRAEAFLQNPVPMDAFLANLGTTQRLVYESGKTSVMHASFINSYGNVEFPGVLANVVDDSVYDEVQAQRDTA